MSIVLISCIKTRDTDGTAKVDRNISYIHTHMGLCYRQYVQLVSNERRALYSATPRMARFSSRVRPDRVFA